MTGIDIVQLSRIHPEKESLVRHLLTPLEQQEYEKKRTEKQKREYLGGRFAAKEAIFKATQDPAYLSYSILHKENGMPYVYAHPEMEVSIAHDGDYAIAIVIVRPANA